MDYLEILRMVRSACRDNFYSGIKGVEDKAVESATQIYIEQMRIEAENKRANVNDLINQLIDRIDIDVSRYEADIALTHDNDFDNHCDLCNDTVFTSIHNIIRAYRRGNNE